MNSKNHEIFKFYQYGKTNLYTTFDIFSNKKKNIKKSSCKSNTSLNDILTELNNLIGLDNVKKLVKEIIAFIEIQEKRKAENLLTEPIVLHMVFKGNPGTGKTTVARLLGKIFKEIGILEKGHLIEVDRADLVGEYIGHTAVKVKEQIKRSLGGILFIDEAYSLARGGEKDFGKEAIDTLVKAMEDHKDNFVLILAGYKNEMDYFLKTNPGLKSRFPIYVDFKDYSIKELILIAKKIASDRQYQFSNKAILKIEHILKKKVYNNGNARYVRNIIERAIRRQAVRLKNKHKVTRYDLLTILEEDIVEDDLY
ncbi:stage V sporulation protein K [Caloranaerobacter sp. TR13]|uniref:AAA family ATPase n=1 Tax=Caloranaerobacter sp. TR13 TaxID=1302151 RepID=UPI0006D3C386|nr:AAA family ATPase [Caloranaerobacter sp. TR13]KPU28147.1 stage V sporulation protein K [Caloranaerobacter sp. TR13]